MFRAVHLTVIKGYHFPQPVWDPEALATEFHFLADPAALWAKIEEQSKRDLGKIGPWRRRRKRLAAGELGWLKPIRNPRHWGSAFWLNLYPEYLRTAGGLDYRRPLPVFPLQVLPFKSRAEVVVEKAGLARWLGQDALADLKVAPQLLIYPAGAVAVELRLYLEWGGDLDLSGLAELGDHLAAWPLAVRDGEGQVQQFRGVFPLFDYLASLLFGLLLEGKTPLRKMPGYGLVYNLQGDASDLGANEAGLARLLGAGHLAGRRLQRSLTGAPDSLIAVDGHRVLLYIDPELGRRRKRKGEADTDILSGRRFFRQKVLTTVELAYLSAALLADYQARFEDLKRELALAGLESDLLSRLINRFHLGALSPRAYGTLTDSLLLARERLGQDPSGNRRLWQEIYDRVLAGQEGAGQLENLERAAQEIYDLAVEYKGKQAEQLQAVAGTVAKAAKELLPSLVKVNLG